MSLSETASADEISAARLFRAEFRYGLAVFLLAVAAVAFALVRQGAVLPNHDAGAALFFVAYGVLTITIGYPHPHFGYYSFDRVAQVASVLVLGPVDAAWINGLASLLYPWHRVFSGTRVRDALAAAMTNSGIMALMILVGGQVYLWLGGPLPLLELSWHNVGVLLALVLCMQALNDLGMLGALHASGRDSGEFFNLFSVGLELGAGATGVLVAIVFNSMSSPVFVLLLGVLTLFMLSMRQFALMRHRLELLVQERTRDLQAKTVELEREVVLDTLTRLYNRRFGDNYLDRHFKVHPSERRPLTIAFADIDRFKQINDGYSHATGDEVLRRVADVLRSSCRKTDVVVRYGGEEFLLCFPGTTLRDAERLCEELRAAVEHEQWDAIGLKERVTLSFGVVSCEHKSTREAVLDAADLRLYAAKNGGRNRVMA